MQPTQDRFWSKVDKTSHPQGCWIWLAARTKKGYGTFYTREKRTVYAHRYAWTLTHGEPRQVLDHTCFNHWCVNPDHLRDVSRKQNGENRSGLDANNTSGYRGVTWHKARRKWRAQIKGDGVNRHLGLFDDLHEAAEAARLARLSLFTHNDLDRKAS